MIGSLDQRKFSVAETALREIANQTGQAKRHEDSQLCTCVKCLAHQALEKIAKLDEEMVRKMIEPKKFEILIWHPDGELIRHINIESFEVTNQGVLHFKTTSGYEESTNCRFRVKVG